MSLTFGFYWQILLADYELDVGILSAPTEPNQAITVHCTTWNLRTKRRRWSLAKYSLERAGASCAETDIKQ